MGKTTVVHVTFLRDVACQKSLNSANVSRSYAQNNTGTVFFETRCSLHRMYCNYKVLAVCLLLLIDCLVEFLQFVY